MPSKALEELVAQIERQPTDNFGKFYLYASLLNVLTVRQQSFLDTIPKYQGFSGSQLQYRTLDPAFSASVDRYKAQFVPKVLYPIAVVQKILLAFLRKGQLSDLFFIIKKMNDHLKTQPLADRKYNLSVYNNISFERRRGGVVELLECAQRVTTYAQGSIDNTVYGFLTFFTALIAMHVLQVLGGLVMGLILLAAGYSTYRFLQNAVSGLRLLGAEVQRCNDITKGLINHQTDNLYTPNNLNFIIKSVLKPIAYASVTVQEQMSFNQRNYEVSEENRKFLDILFPLVDISSGLAGVKWS